MMMTLHIYKICITVYMPHTASRTPHPWCLMRRFHPITLSQSDTFLLLVPVWAVITIIVAILLVVTVISVCICIKCCCKNKGGKDKKKKGGMFGGKWT